MEQCFKRYLSPCSPLSFSISLQQDVLHHIKFFLVLISLTSGLNLRRLRLKWLIWFHLAHLDKLLIPSVPCTKFIITGGHLAVMSDSGVQHVKQLHWPYIPAHCTSVTIIFLVSEKKMKSIVRNSTMDGMTKAEHMLKF